MTVKNCYIDTSDLVPRSAQRRKYLSAGFVSEFINLVAIPVASSQLVDLFNMIGTNYVFYEQKPRKRTWSENERQGKRIVFRDVIPIIDKIIKTVIL